MKKYLKITVLAFVAIALAASCFVHQYKGNGLDFFAYYKAADRALSLRPFYVDEADYAFKYAPISLLYFVPFGFLPYTAARWLYALLHLTAALLLPYLGWKLFTRKPAPFWGVFWGFVASARFVDGEFRDSNFGLFIALFLVGGTLLLRNPHRRWLAPTVMSLGAVVKFHSLLGVLAFRFRTDPKTRGTVGLAGLILLLVPSPLLWFKWWDQMQLTARYTHFSPESFTLQGFYPFSAYFLGLDPLSHLCLLTAVPFGVLAYFLLPRFSIDEAGEDPVSFFLTLGSWVLFGLLCSPLPWQHTYSFLWILFPVAFWAANPRQKAILIFLALCLGLTPRDLIGTQAFSWLESRQSVFLTLWMFWLSLVFQVRSAHEQKRTLAPL